jgi:hypothetical protein
MKANLFRRLIREKKYLPVWTEPLKNPVKTEIIFKRKRKYDNDGSNEISINRNKSI